MPWTATIIAFYSGISQHLIKVRNFIKFEGEHPEAQGHFYAL